MSKSKTVSTGEEVLEILEKTRIFEEYSGFSIRFFRRGADEAEFRVEVGHEKLVLVVRPILHPSRKLLLDADSREGWLLVCPHLPEPLSKELREAGIAHADLNGRLFLRTPASLVDRRPAESGFRSPRSGPDPFAPKASRIVRLLLCQRDATFTQDSLVCDTGVSRAVVSQVLGRWENDGLVRRLSASRPGHPARFQLADFDRLLNEWQAADQWQARTTVQQYSVLSNEPEQIARKVTESLGNESVAFTQWFAAWLRRPHTVSPVVSAYVRKSQLLDVLSARKVSTGGNLWLVLPTDEGVFLGVRESKGFPLVCDVQIYLDLLQVGQRGPEQAEELRQWDGFAR